MDPSNFEKTLAALKDAPPPVVPGNLSQNVLRKIHERAAPAEAEPASWLESLAELVLGRQALAGLMLLALLLGTGTSAVFARRPSPQAVQTTAASALGFESLIDGHTLLFAASPAADPHRHHNH